MAHRLVILYCCYCYYYLDPVCLYYYVQMHGATDGTASYNARHVRILSERAAVYDDVTAVGASRDRI